MPNTAIIRILAVLGLGTRLCMKHSFESFEKNTSILTAMNMFGCNECILRRGNQYLERSASSVR